MINKKYLELKFKKPINLYCFTDVHIGAKAFDRDKFYKIIKMLKKDKDGYCFFNGDTFECTPDGYHNAVNDQNLTINEQVEEYTKIIKDLGKKVLFMRPGNHEQRVANLTGFDIYTRLKEELKIPILNLGNELVYFNFNNKKVSLVTSHGMGGNPNKIMSNLEKMYRGANAYIIGHTHQFRNLNEGFQTFDMSCDSETLKSDVIQLIGGSFMKYADYARHLNHRPTETGCYVLKVDGDNISIFRKLV